MPRKNVLVIDDVSVIRSFVKAALRAWPIDLREASDGRRGLEMHTSSRADLILCDMNMPTMNGEAFLRELREGGDLTPVILLTAEGDMSILGNLIKLGINGYVRKPFKPNALTGQVIDLLGLADAPARD